jgi:hypothetical protein
MSTPGPQKVNTVIQNPYPEGSVAYLPLVAFRVNSYCTQSIIHACKFKFASIAALYAVDIRCKQLEE